MKDISMYSSNVGAELYFSKCESGVSLSFVYGGLEASPQLCVSWSGHFNTIVALVLSLSLSVIYISRIVDIRWLDWELSYRC